MVTVYPTGTTIFDPERCWSGYTLLGGANLVDMNGGLRHSWELVGAHGKPIPDGQVLGDVRGTNRLVQLDWEKEKVWEFDGAAYADELMPHHDFQREGNPVGYYAPGM